MPPGESVEKGAAGFRSPSPSGLNSAAGDFAGIPAAYGATAPPNATQQRLPDKPPMPYVQQLAPLPSDSGCVVPFNVYSPPQTHVRGDPFLKTDAVAFGTPVHLPEHQIVYDSDPEPCCNCYWLLLILGILVFPPLFVCGAVGTASVRYWERIAGLTNLIAIAVYILLAIFVFGVG